MSLGLLMLGDAPVKQLAERARFAESCGFCLARASPIRSPAILH
jgi:hypothetical protein